MSVQLREAAGVDRVASPGPAPGPLLLAGDVGGTKTMLALVNGGGEVLAEMTFASRDHAAPDDVMRAFLGRVSTPVDGVCLSVAGPVIDGRASITNLPWVLDEDRLAASLGTGPVRLINDLQATAYALSSLRPDQLCTLHPGTPEPSGTRAVIAVGTGLGEGALLSDGDGREAALPSEGGHTDFAPRDATQRGLLAWLQRQYEHVSYERVCSGHGIPNLYHYLRARTGIAEPAWLTAALAAADDPTPVIADAGLRGACPVSRRTLSLFAAILGAEAGNLALRTLATGGVFVGGGIPPKLRPVLRGRAFREGYLRKGVMSDVVARFPVHLILEPRAALLGAARYAAAARA
jgi:glucokinase